MSLQQSATLPIPSDLVEAIRAFPVERIVEHCGSRFTVSPFDFYADCPRCGKRIKVRAFAAVPEVEDVFDAVFEWMNRPEARALVARRQRALADDESA